MNIHLHVGFHKTGTTFIQDSLKNSRKSLISKGVYYVPLNELRNNITHKLNKRKLTNLELLDLKGYICSITERASSLGCNTIILSDENTLGFPIQVTNELYWTAKTRLYNLHYILDDIVVGKILLTVREYSNFFQSLFLEANKKRFVDTTQVNKSYLMSFSFFDIVKILNQVFKDANLEVITFESFVKSHNNFFRSITGLDNIDGIISYSNEKRVSPSPQAYLDSKEIYNLSTITNETKANVHRMLLNSSFHNKVNKSLIFTESEVDILKKKYALEIDKI